jgi:hypothetical protein
MPASSSENRIAKNWNIVERADSRFAIRAERTTGADHRLAIGQPVYAYVQETADTQAENESDNFCHVREHMRNLCIFLKKIKIDIENAHISLIVLSLAQHQGNTTFLGFPVGCLHNNGCSRGIHSGDEVKEQEMQWLKPMMMIL